MPVGSILTAKEVRELTGCRRRDACIRQLQRQGVPFVIAADGWPRVCRDALLGGSVVSIADRDRQEPNLDALNP